MLINRLTSRSVTGSIMYKGLQSSGWISKELFESACRPITLVITIMGIMTLSACGGSSKVASKEDGPDITRPPVLIGEQRIEEVQTAPDEIISYEEWQERLRKRAEKPSVEAKSDESKLEEKLSYEEWQKSRVKAKNSGAEDLSFEEWQKRRAEAADAKAQESKNKDDK